MVRRYDALDQQATLPDPIDVPGCVVQFESLEFLRSIKWDWKGFYQKNKGSYGVVQLSDMAFSENGRYVVFYFSITQDFLSGAGYYVFMENTGLGWQTKFMRMIWIS